MAIPLYPLKGSSWIRWHHLLKTFWAGAHGWKDRQLLDGAVIWTAPTGKTYTTHPGSRLLLPTWHASTTAPSALTRTPAAAVSTFGNRGAIMPQRRRTRAAETARRIRAERALNDALVAERNKPPPF